MLSCKFVMPACCSLTISEPSTARLALNFLRSIFRPYRDDRVRDMLSENNVSWRGGIRCKAPKRSPTCGTISKGNKASSFPIGMDNQNIQCRHLFVEGGECVG